MSRTIITAQTAAVTAKAAIQFNRVPATLFATVLSAGDEIPVFYSHDGGTTWEALYLDGVEVKITSVHKAITVYGPMHLAVTKPLTDNAVGVYASDTDEL